MNKNNNMNNNNIMNKNNIIKGVFGFLNGYAYMSNPLRRYIRIGDITLNTIKQKDLIYSDSIIIDYGTLDILENHEILFIESVEWIQAIQITMSFLDKGKENKVYEYIDKYFFKKRNVVHDGLYISIPELYNCVVVYCGYDGIPAGNVHIIFKYEYMSYNFYDMVGIDTKLMVTLEQVSRRDTNILASRRNKDSKRILLYGASGTEKWDIANRILKAHAGDIRDLRINANDILESIDKPYLLLNNFESIVDDVVFSHNLDKSVAELILGVTDNMSLIAASSHITRPGRFDLCIEIPLPKNEHRLKLLDDDTFLTELTSNFTISELKNTLILKDFSMKSLTSLYGRNETKLLSDYVTHGIIEYNNDFKERLAYLTKGMMNFFYSRNRLLKVLLHGHKKTGKTSLAVWLSLQHPEIKMIKIITQHELMGKDIIGYINSVLNDLLQSESSVLILDDVHTYNVDISMILNPFIRFACKKLVIIMTSTTTEYIDECRLSKYIPTISDTDSIETIQSSLGIFDLTYEIHDLGIKHHIENLLDLEGNESLP